MPRSVNLANLLTATRLVLVPFIIAAIIENHHVRALILFACAALTDGLDGLAARATGLVTRLGAYLDPIADKCLLSGVFLALAAAGLAPVWFVAVIFGRDLYILAAAGILIWFTAIRSFPPSIWGKMSTFVQVVTATVWMAADATASSLLETAANAMLWPCAAFTLWSGAHYTWRGLCVCANARPRKRHGPGVGGLEPRGFDRG
ncbi:MAG TPA: CDP-alcohol phosphatidyltransferase family protein [Bryobacteraceae bacterium]|nr:CDP-alcohol phosphatidyltransferase family protein [Bryobacteraceae bacterium]